jgi:serine/threonine-protein kinase
MDIIKVLDFGISKVALTGNVFESSMPLVKTMMPMGSPVYMSPEQIRNSSDIDPRTDIWSLGCVLFELLTAHAPFEAPSITLLTATILEQAAPLLREQCPEATRELEAIVAKCLEKDPNRRYQDVGELAVALFPFAPRRARLSAERCCYVLRSAGLSQASVELSSIHPPSMDSSHIGVTVPNKSATRTTGPAAVSMKDVPVQGAGGRSKLFILALLGAFAVMGAFAFLRQRSAPGSLIAAPAVAAQPANPPAPAVENAAPTFVPAVPAVPVVETIVPGSTAPSATLDKKSKSADKSEKAKKAREAREAHEPAAPAAPAAPAISKSAAPSHEVDVGF